MIGVAATSRNQDLASSFEAFLALTPEMQASLLASIEVLDGQSMLGDLEQVLEGHLQLAVPRGKAAAARELLEGWWWPRVCAALERILIMLRHSRHGGDSWRTRQA